MQYLSLDNQIKPTLQVDIYDVSPYEYPNSDILCEKMVFGSRLVLRKSIVLVMSNKTNVRSVQNTVAKLLTALIHDIQFVLSVNNGDALPAIVIPQSPTKMKDIHISRSEKGRVVVCNPGWHHRVSDGMRKAALRARNAITSSRLPESIIGIVVSYCLGAPDCWGATLVSMQEQDWRSNEEFCMRLEGYFPQASSFDDDFDSLLAGEVMFNQTAAETAGRSIWSIRNHSNNNNNNNNNNSAGNSGSGSSSSSSSSSNSDTTNSKSDDSNSKSDNNSKNESLEGLE